MPQIYQPPKEFTCCFTGHRSIPLDDVDLILTKLDLEIGWLYSHGVTDFVTGGALGFDTLAARAILRSRRRNHDIKLHLYLPSPHQAASWKPTDVQIYDTIRELADSVSIIGTNNSAQCMHMRNHAMVDASSYCVAYYDPATFDPEHPNRGGTFNTIKYAKTRGLSVTNLHDAHPAELQTTHDFML